MGMYPGMMAMGAMGYPYGMMGGANPYAYTGMVSRSVDESISRADVSDSTDQGFSLMK